MKHTLSLLLITISVSLTLLSCSKDDSPQVYNPRFRVKNENTSKATVQVKTSGGNTVNFNNVAKDSITTYQDVAEGNVEATASVQGLGGPAVKSFTAEKNKDFTVVVLSSPDSVRLRIDVAAR